MRAGIRRNWFMAMPLATTDMSSTRPIVTTMLRMLLACTPKSRETFVRLHPSSYH